MYDLKPQFHKGQHFIQQENYQKSKLDGPLILSSV